MSSTHPNTLQSDGWGRSGAPSGRRIFSRVAPRGVRSTRRWCSMLALALALVGGPSVARAEDRAPRVVTREWLVSTLLARSPALNVSALEVAQAREGTRLQAGQFPYMFEADAGYTHMRTPVLGSSDTSGNDTYAVGAQISRTYPSGTTATIRAEGERFSSSRASTSAAFTNQLGRGYQASLRATVTQPLLQGYGATVNEAGWRAAKINEERARKAYLRTTSEAVRDVLSAYWELWYAGRAIEIQRAALELASAQQRDADARVERGALSPADALKFRTQVATLTESLLNARANETEQALELGRLVGTPEQAYDWRADMAPPAPVTLLSRAQVLNKVLAQSPSIGELEQAVRLAVEQRRTAGEPYRPTLDVQGWVEADGLDTRLLPAAGQVGKLGAVSVFGGITYQTTLDTERLRAARAQADYDIRIARGNLDGAVQQLQSAVSQMLLAAEQANVSYEAANKTLEVATQQAQNERQRFSLGASTPLDVQVAEDAVRQAQLRVLRATVDRVKAWLNLSHQTGELLARYAPNAGSAQ
jgi:outer membrane protein